MSARQQPFRIRQWHRHIKSAGLSPLVGIRFDCPCAIIQAGQGGCARWDSIRRRRGRALARSPAI